MVESSSKESTTPASPSAMPPDVADTVERLHDKCSDPRCRCSIRTAADMLESLSAQLRANRQDTLEEAAKVAMDWPLTHGMSAAHKASAFSISAAIRALAAPTSDPSGRAE